MMKIIGIDPGLAGTGVGIINSVREKIASFSYGCIHTSSNKSLPTRLDQIFSALSDILKEEKPDVMVVEDIFSLAEYPMSGINLGKVTGVVMLAGSRMGIPVTEIAVREAKQILTGNGNASKAQLEMAVRRQLSQPCQIKPYHASDALGLAIIGMFRHTKNFSSVHLAK
jgi:crossover junction endodeoxyribonuclease RuvC